MSTNKTLEDRHVHFDVVPKDVDKDDVEFKRHVASIEAIQHERAGYLDAKGALDKGDAAFMIEQEEKRQHAINARDMAEKMAFYSLKSKVLTQDQDTRVVKEKKTDRFHSSYSSSAKRRQRDVLGAVLGSKKKKRDEPAEGEDKKEDPEETTILQGLLGDYGSDDDAL